MKQIFNITLVSVLIVLGSCSKKGCTDPTADNYDTEAEKDNGLCEYGIDMTFYMSTTRANELSDAGVTPPFTVEVGTSTTVGIKTVGPFNWETDSTLAVAPPCDSTGVGIYKFRYLDYNKGNTTVAISAKLANGALTYNIGIDLALGEDGCYVREM